MVHRKKSMMVKIRKSLDLDREGIRKVHEEAFQGLYESRVVELLINAHKALVSLVAVEDELIIGHILFSLITIEPDQPAIRGVGLAPVGVLPEYQGNGIGSQLIRLGIEECREQGFDLIVVLGAPDYYSRFGFTNAKEQGLENEYGADAAFMVLRISNCNPDGIKGIVKYQPEFKGPG